MSSERYDEAVREQKKAERKKQVQKQVMILVIALVVIAVAAAAVDLPVRSVQAMRHLLLRQIRMRLRKT